MDSAFRTEMADGYGLDEPAVIARLAAARRRGPARTSASRSPLSRINRHGLIAGATGTGKTKTLQILAGQLSRPRRARVRRRRQGRPLGHRRAGRRQRTPRSSSAASRSAGRSRPPATRSRSCRCRARPGAHVRASVSSFGPLLLGKVLDLNETQTSILSLVFRYCDDQHLPLLDLADLRTTLKFLGSDDGKAGPRGPGRDQPGVAGRDPAVDRDDRAGGRRHLLRRARVRRRRPAPDDASTAGAW